MQQRIHPPDSRTDNWHYRPGSAGVFIFAHERWKLILRFRARSAREESKLEG